MISNSEEMQFILRAGDELPSFSVTLNDGTEISNESLSGKVSVIVFFNTECPDCRKELPVIQDVYEYFKNCENVVLFAVSREQGLKDIM